MSVTGVVNSTAKAYYLVKGRRTAGRSAIRQARALQLKYAQRVGTWAGGAALVGAVGSGLAISNPNAWEISSLSTSAAVAAGWASGRKPSGAKRWIQGGRAEQRTGGRLAVMVGRGWWVAHDRQIPKSRANLDHIALPPHGQAVAYVDTKAWHAKGAVIRWDAARNRLMYGPWDQSAKLNTVKWEAEKLAEGAGIPSIPVIAVDGGRVEGGIVKAGEVWIVQADRLVEFLNSMTSASAANLRQQNKVRTQINRTFKTK